MPLTSTGRPFGLTHINPETGETLIKRFGSTDTFPGPILPPEAISRAWQWAIGTGPVIQESLPDFSPDTRELFLSGIASSEWEEYFPSEPKPDIEL